LISSSAKRASVSNLVVSDSSRESEVTIFTPIRTPRVLNFPRSISRVVTNKENCVVDRSTAIREDTTSVVLKHSSINSNSNNTLFDSTKEAVASSDLSVASNSVGLLGRNLACTSNTRVRISSFSGQTVNLDVIKSNVSETTTTTVVFSAAIKELLLRETRKNFSSNECSTFNTTSGSKSPASTTAALVFHRGNCTLGNPVNNGGISKISINLFFEINNSRDFSLNRVKVSLSELLWGDIHEFSDTKRFNSLDRFNIREENIHSVNFVIRVIVREAFSVGFFELSPHLELFWGVSRIAIRWSADHQVGGHTEKSQANSGEDQESLHCRWDWKV